MALTLTHTRDFPTEGPTGPYLFTGRVSLRVGVSGSGAPSTLVSIARVELIDTLAGLARPITPERMVSPDSTDPGPRGVFWKGTHPPSSRTYAQRDDEQGWIFHYDTDFEWARLVQLTAVAYNGAGAEIGRVSLDRPARIANTGGYIGLLSVNGKKGTEAWKELERPQSGKMTLVVRCHRSDRSRTPNTAGVTFDNLGLGEAKVYLRVFVDDERIQQDENPAVVGARVGGHESTNDETGAASYTVDIQTSRYMNGQRHVRFVAESVEPEPIHNLIRKQTVLGAQTPADNTPMVLEFAPIFNNGRTPMQVIPKWRDVYLLPGESVTVPCELLHTDGYRSLLTAADGLRIRAEGRVYVGNELMRDGRLIATSNGVDEITAAATPGLDTFTLFTAELQQYALDFRPRVLPAEIKVNVIPARVFPHFGKGANRFLDTYTPGESFIVANLFGIGLNDFAEDEPGLVAELEAAGFNAINSGIYANGRTMGVADLAAYQAAYDAKYADLWAFLARNPGLFVLASGDDVARDRNDFNWVVKTAFGLDTVGYAFQKAAESGQVLLIDMVDEANMTLGASPTPDEPWLDPDGNPTIPEDSLLNIVAAARQGAALGANEIAISWPILGLSHPWTAHAYFNDPAIGDYASLFWTIYTKAHWLYDTPEDLYYGISRGHRTWMVKRAMPRLGQVSGMAEFYAKLSAGNVFDPTRDLPYHITRIGNDPLTAPLQLWYTLAEGCAGVRLYTFDGPGTGRGDTDLPRLGEAQTGISPTVRPDMWESYSLALNLAHELEDLVLTPQAHAPYLHPKLATGRKSSDAGEMLIICNFSVSDIQAPIPADVGAGLAGGTLVRIIGTEKTTTAVAGAPGTVTIPAMETWIFYKRTV